MASRSFVLFGVLVLIAMITAEKEAAVVDDAKAKVADVATAEDLSEDALANKNTDIEANSADAAKDSKLDDRKVKWGKLAGKAAELVADAAATAGVTCLLSKC